MSHQQRDVVYDWLMSMPVIYSGLSAKYKAQNNRQALAMLRQEAKQLFQDIALFPHDTITLNASGKMAVSQTKIARWVDRSKVLADSSNQRKNTYSQ